LAVEGIFGFLEKSSLTKGFLEWMRRTQRCIETNGDYVWKSKRNILVVIGFRREVLRCYTSVEHPIGWNETCAEGRAEEAYTDGEKLAVRNPNGIYATGCNEKSEWSHQKSEDCKKGFREIGTQSFSWKALVRI
jgi:hypothetical protein